MEEREETDADDEHDDRHYFGTPFPVAIRDPPDQERGCYEHDGDRHSEPDTVQPSTTTSLASRRRPFQLSAALA